MFISSFCYVALKRPATAKGENVISRVLSVQRVVSYSHT